MLRLRLPVGLLLLGAVWALGAGADVAQEKALAAMSKPEAAPRQAAAASGTESLNPRLLGTTEGVFDYCAKADPKGAAKVHARLKRLVEGVSKEALSEARKSEEYQKARSAVDDFVAKVDSRNASRMCSGPVAARKLRS